MARFFRRGVSKVFFHSGTDLTTPPAINTVITGGTDLTPDIAEIAGFSLESGTIAVPDLANRYTKTIPGEDQTQNSTITFYDNDASTTIRTALAKGTIGYIGLLPYGNVSTKRAEVWVVQSIGVNDQWTAGNEAAKYVVSFAVLEVPDQNSTLT